MSATKERRHIRHDKAQAIEDSPGDTDSFEPGAAFIHRPSGTGEVHEQQGYRSSDDGGDSGDGEDLGVYILHDLFGLGPYICCRISRLAEHHGHHHTQEGAVSHFGQRKPALGLGIRLLKLRSLRGFRFLQFVLISPPELRIPEYIREDVLRANNIEFKEVGNLDEAMPELDILYMTRVQKERFFNEDDYIRLKDCYILNKEKMKLAKEKMFVLHPLPRVNEISVEVDDDPRAAYFRQVQYGVYVRMALIMTLLEVEKPC